MIIHADCILAMADMKPSSIDAIITDPPYGLEFMGKEWDAPHKAWDKRERDEQRESSGRRRGGYIGLPERAPSQFQAGLNYQLWTQSWATEALRVLKPGGSLLSFGGTRTFHRLTCGLEDAGFVIKDCLMWLYGQGFPKAQDLGKMIDKRNGRRFEDRFALGKHIKERREALGYSHKQINEWLGSARKSEHFESDSLGFATVPTLKDWHILSERLGLSEEWLPLIERTGAERGVVGKSNSKIHLENLGEAGYREEWDITLPASDLARHWDGYKIGGIKPSFEPIIWAVKPPEGAWIDNVLKYGTGAVNVDECRVGTDSEELEKARCNFEKNQTHKKTNTGQNFLASDKLIATHGKGRYPANLLLSHTPDCREVGTKRVKAGGGKPERGNIFKGGGKSPMWNYADPDGYETISAWECVEDCPVRLLDEQSGDLTRWFNSPRDGKGESGNDVFGNHAGTGAAPTYDTGGASRFFYTSKATDRQDYNDHPTLKPTDLIEWLIRLVTRPGQTVLDCFAGSGTTGVAAIQSGREFILIEQDSHYCDIC